VSLEQVTNDTREVRLPLVTISHRQPQLQVILQLGLWHFGCNPSSSFLRSIDFVISALEFGAQYLTGGLSFGHAIHNGLSPKV
jgi:hypothetical protein